MTTKALAIPQTTFSKLAIQAFGMLGILTVLTGVVYPLLVTGVAQVIFPHQANGSLITKNGKVIGSSLIGQSFESPRFFWGRLSATSPQPYNASASTGSNLGPTNEALTKNAQARLDALQASAPTTPNLKIPVDLVTSSASGLDPHISPAAAEVQIPRVANARGVAEDRVRALVARHTESRDLGILGEPRVNVLELNLALETDR